MFQGIKRAIEERKRDWQQKSEEEISKRADRLLTEMTYGAERDVKRVLEIQRVLEIFESSSARFWVSATSTFELTSMTPNTFDKENFIAEYKTLSASQMFSIDSSLTRGLSEAYTGDDLGSQMASHLCRATFRTLYVGTQPYIYGDLHKAWQTFSRRTGLPMPVMLARKIA